METQEYIGTDSAEEIGELKDIQARHPLINQDKSRREVIEFVEFTCTNEPRGQNGDKDAKGVFLDATARVCIGDNENEEFTQRIHSDRRIKAGRKASAYRSQLLPFVKGVVEATLGKDQVDSFFVGAVQSNDTYLEDITSRLQSVLNKRCKVEVGVERGQTTKNAAGEDITFRDKQIITAFYPKGK